MKNRNLTYYFYSHGNNITAMYIAGLIRSRDYKGFMAFFNSPLNGNYFCLPDEAYPDDYDYEYNPKSFDITKKKNFDRITYFEFEHG